MTNDITSMFSSSNSIEYLVEQYMRFESRPRDTLVKQQDGLYGRKDVLSDLDSTLSALQNKAERLTDPVTDYFALRDATVSDSEIMTATASSTAGMGNHSITIDRLAISDTRVSMQYVDDDNDWNGHLNDEDQIFKIEVAHPTDLDANNRVEVEITVAADTFDLNHRDALLAIADAINSAMYSAVGDETIESSEQVRASVVSEEAGMSRLVMRSESAGFTYRMDFSVDSADDLLDEMGMWNYQAMNGANGGYITDVGTTATDSLLNSKFNIDGLDFYRDSNNVTDALSGVTLKLLDTTATTQAISVAADTENVKTEVNSYIKAYNDALKYLKEQTQINPDTYERGELSDDITYKGILYELRSLSISSVTGVNNSDYSKLFNIGIETDSDGYLSIADSDKFEAAIETNSDYVADIFNASDGIATRIGEYLENYVKVGGTIDSSKRNIDDQLTSLTDRMSLMDEILSRRESQLRTEFTRLQETMYRLSSQQSFLGSFFGG